jgi:hypothetical protein
MQAIMPKEIMAVSPFVPVKIRNNINREKGI